MKEGQHRCEAVSAQRGGPSGLPPTAPHHSPGAADAWLQPSGGWASGITAERVSMHYTRWALRDRGWRPPSPMQRGPAGTWPQEGGSTPRVGEAGRRQISAAVASLHLPPPCPPAHQKRGWPFWTGTLGSGVVWRKARPAEGQTYCYAEEVRDKELRPHLSPKLGSLSQTLREPPAPSRALIL